ncbi:MAG: DUF4258 domain-containing protein [Burkholderiales bacterium]|jgi:hypothetical protein|nr:DUF4258 domain-containing protein [Burkholderiales bacterium]
MGRRSTVFALGTGQVEQLIRTRAADSAAVYFTEHARIQMRKRHIGVDLALEVLRRGALRRAPEPNLARGSLECRMERYIAGRNLGVVAALSDADPGLVVVTAMELGGSR